jgi:DNA repair protein RecO (recombination protein O)
MRQYRDAGVVLRTYKLGEADRIAVVLTAEHGKVRAVAKGARKPTSRLSGRIEPGSHVAMLLHEGRSLDVIAQAERIDHFRSLREDLDRITKAAALLEVADQVCQEREPNVALYQMLLGALRALAAADAPLLVPSFFWKVLALEGLRPELDACVRCGVDGPLVAFDVDEGGVLCREHRRGAALSPEALALVRRTLGGELASVLREPASPATHEVEVLATRTLEHHLERRLRAVSLLEHGT